MLRCCLARYFRSTNSAVVRNNRRKLIERGILADKGQGVLRVMADIEFNSPSGAAVVITGEM